jgi:hypothetical protein
MRRCEKELRPFRVAPLLRIQVIKVEADAVLDFTFSQVLQGRKPFAELEQALCNGAGEEDVPRIAAVYHPFGEIDPAAGHVRVVVDVSHAVDGAAVQPHPEFDLRGAPEGLGDLDGAPDVSDRITQEDQRHAVSARQGEDFPVLRGGLKRLGLTNDLLKLIDERRLLFHGQARVSHEVHVEHVSDFQLKGEDFGRHRGRTDTHNEKEGGGKGEG